MIKRLNRYPTDAMIREGARLVRESMLSVLPDPSECEHEFPEEFEIKMRRVFRKEKRIRTMRATARTIAAVFAAMLIGTTVWLTIDTNARAAVCEWFQEVYKNSIVYKYFGEKKVDELPEYELGYLPDGFELVDEFRSEMRNFEFYLNEKTGGEIVFEYGFIKDTSILTANNVNKSILYDKILIKGYNAEYYNANEKTNSNSLILYFESIICKIDSTIEQQEIIKIAENIILKK